MTPDNYRGEYRISKYSAHQLDVAIMKDVTPNLARQGTRLINAIVDTISWMALWLLLSFGLIFLGYDQTIVDEAGEQIPAIPIIVLPIFWGYYILAEYFFQRTLGKLLTRTKVVTKTGDKPTFGQIVGRTLSRSIPFEYL